MLEQFPWPQTGAVGILAAAVFMLLRGLLVPRSTLDKMISVYESRIAEKAEEAKEWKEAWRLLQETNQITTKQLDELLEIGRTSGQVLKSLPTTQGVAHVEH